MGLFLFAEHHEILKASSWYQFARVFLFAKFPVIKRDKILQSFMKSWTLNLLKWLTSYYFYW